MKNSLQNCETKWPCSPWPSKTPNKLKPINPPTDKLISVVSWHIFIFPCESFPAWDNSLQSLNPLPIFLFLISSIVNGSGCAFFCKCWSKWVEK
jgi:hypothetical protein